MKKQTLWKRIFGQNPNKKVKTQQAFQEQFDTKLRFRELEPRVVLDATVDYSAGVLNITYTSAGDVTLGRDVGGNLEVTGTNITFTKDATDNFVGQLTNVGTINVTDDTAGASEFILYGGVGGTGTNALTGLVSNSIFFNNVDQVNVQDGSNFSVSSFSYTSNGADTDDNTINFDGEVSIQTNLTFNANGSKSVSVTDTGNGAVTTEALIIEKSGAATGNLSVDLTNGTNDVIQMFASGEEVEIALVDSVGNLSLGDINASELSLTTTGTIFGDASSEINVSGTAKLTAASITLSNSTVGHDFNKLTLKSTGTASIVETDGFNFDGNSVVDGALTVIVKSGDIGQEAGSTLYANGTAGFTVADTKNIDLGETGNRFEGTVSVFASSGRAGAVTFYDSNGGFQFGSTLATTLDLTTTGGISQTSDGIDVLGNAVFTTMGANAINLNSTNNAFGANVSATGNGGPAATVTIVDSDGKLTLDDIQAATLSATAINGGIYQTLAGIKVTGTSSFTVQDGANVFLTTGSTNNAFVGAVSISGASGAAGTVAVFQATGDLKLGAIDATSLTIGLDDGSISQTSAGVQVSGDTQFAVGNTKSILLDSSNNDFGGELDLIATSGIAENIEVHSSGMNLLLDQVEASGNLTIVMTNGGITQTNVGAFDYVRVGKTSSFTVADGADIELGTNTNNQFNTVSAQGQSGAAGDVLLYDSDGDLTLDAIVATNLTAENSAGGIVLGAITASSLTVTASGAVSDAGDTSILDVSGLTSITAASIDLSTTTDTEGHELDTLTIVTTDGLTGDASIKEADGFTVTGTNTVLGNLTIVAGGAVIQDVGSSLTVVKAMDVTVAENSDVIFYESNNDFQGTVSVRGSTLRANEVKFRDNSGGIQLDEIVSTSLQLNSSGAITQTGTGIDVSESTTILVSNNENVTLNDTDNDFGDITVIAKISGDRTGDVSIYDKNDIVINRITSNSLTVTALETVSDKASSLSLLDVTGLTFITAESIDLTKTFMPDGHLLADVQFVTTGTGVEGYVNLKEVDGFSFKGINTITGDLTVETGGGIGQVDGGLSVSGTTNLTVADDAAVTLDKANDFVGAVSIDGATTNAGAVTLNDTAGGIILGAIDAASLSVTSATNITQTTDGVKVSGASSFVVDNFENVTLNDDDNEFNEVSVSSSGLWANNVIINDNDSAANGITLAKIDAWTLNVTTVGAIQDTATEEIFAITATFDGGSLDLTNYVGPGHDLNAVTLQIDGDAKLNEATGGFFFTGDNSVGGLLEVTTSGQISLFGGKLVVTGTTDLTAGGIISLSGGMNDFQDTVTLSGTDITIQDANGIELGNVTANSLNVDAFGGHITQTATTILDIATTTVARATTGFNVILGNDNDFTGSVSVVGFSNPTDVVLNDVNDLIIADIDSVTLTATAGMSITQQAGKSILASTSADLTAGTTITLRDVTTPTLSLTAGDTISQEAGTSLLVSGMTMVEVAEGVTVDLSEVTNELGSISVNDSNTMATPGMEVYAGTVTIYDGGNDNADAMLGTDDDGLTLKNIWADILTVTSAGTEGAIIQALDTAIHADKTGASSASLTAGSSITLRDITTPTLNLTAGKGISQESGTALIVSGMTTVEAGTGENVDLSETGNDFGSIGVVGTGATAAGDVTIVDADGGIVLKDIIATNLMVTVNDTADVVLIDQMAATSLNVSGMATFVNNTGGHVLITQTGNKLNQVGATALSGIVSIYDAEGGIALKDIAASVLTVTVDDSMNVVNVTQVAATTINVSAGTSIDNQTGGNVDLSNAGNLLDTIFVSAVDMAVRGDVTIRDDDGGLVLASITAANLDVTVNDTMDVVNVTQVSMTKLDVTSMTTVTNNTGGNIILANDDNLINQFGATTVGGSVVVVDSDGGIVLKDIVAGNLDVTVNDTMDVVHVTQLGGTKLDVTSMTTVTNNTGGDILLGNDNLLNQFGAITDKGGVRGNVVVNDVDGGIVLKDIVAENLTVTVDDSDDEAVNITQAALATIDVNSMSMFNNYSSYSVDMVGGNVILANSGNKFFQIGVVAEDPVTKYRGDVTIADDYDGLELKNIVAANLTVTVDDIDDNMVVDLKQVAGETIDVAEMTMITNKTGGTVNLFNTGNEIAQIMVTSKDAITLVQGDIYINDDYNDLLIKDIVGNKLEAVAVGAISQEDTTSIETIKSVILTSETKSITLGEIVTGDLTATAETFIYADAGTTVDAENSVSLTANTSTITVSNIETETLTMKAAGDISQLEDSLLTIGKQTNLILTASGSITLLNDGDIDPCVDLDRTDGNDLSDDVTLTLSDLTYLENFEILNINEMADIPTGDFQDAVNNGTVTDLTLKYTQAPVVTLPAINILGDLWIESGDDIRQSDTLTKANIAVGGDAVFDGGQIHLAAKFDLGVNEQNLMVTGNATFIARDGEIEVGVKHHDIDSFKRGEDSGATVNLGTLTFNAATADGHVTITQDNKMTLVNNDISFCMDPNIIENLAQTAALTSTGDGIVTGSVANVTVNDLTSLKAASNIILGDNADADVDFRIVYIEAKANVSLYEQDDANGLNIIDGTKVAGTLAVQTDGHIVQVNEFRVDAPDAKLNLEFNHIFADKALLVSNEGGVVLTSTSFNTLAVSAGDSPLLVDAGSELALGAAGIATGTGFIDKMTMVEGILSTDKIDADLPDDNNDTFALAARADSFVTGDGENYSIVIVDANDKSANNPYSAIAANGLIIGKVEDTAGGNVSTINGIRTNGDDAGHVFVRSLGDGGADGKNDGTLTFGTANAGLVVGLANSGVITALARGNLSIATGSWLHVTDGADPDASAFALVSTVEDFVDSPDSKFEIDNTANPTPNEGPSYSRITGTVDTYVLGTQTGKDSTATIVLDKLGTPGTPDELDFEVTLNFADTTPLQEVYYPQLIDSDTAILHDIPWEFATTNASTLVTLQAYNSPQINLFGNVVAANNFNNLNIVVDQFEIFFLTPIDFVPEMTNFVPPNNPYVAPIMPPEANPTPYASLTEIADDTRVATQIDGVTIVEVDPSNFMEKGEKMELDDDFMTLDAVKEYIQNGVQFPVGLYKIEILYPGSKEPEVYFYWKQDRLDPFDLFSNDTKPVSPKVVELAAANQATAQLSAEEVWAREYDKWFPGVADQQPMEDLSVPAAEGDSGEMIPSDDDILIERVSTVSLQEIDRMTDRLRAKRSIVRDSLNGAMIGGAALMAAVAAQGRKDDEATNHHPEEQGAQPEDSLDEISLGRLRRRVRQWL